MNKFSYELFIALRYIRAKRKQVFISLITLISIVGVAIGVMALILVLGVMTGFTDDLREKILGTNSHIVINKYFSGIKDHETKIKALNKLQNVSASTPFIISTVMLSSGSRVSPVILHGIDIPTAPDVIDIKKSIIEGDLTLLQNQISFDNNTKHPGIIIGKELSEILGIGTGSPVTVISPTGLISPAGMIPGWKKFIVAGIFESGMYEYDTGMAYISLPDAQKFVKMPEEVGGIWLKVNDIYDTEKVVAKIRNLLGTEYQVRDWKEMHKNLYAALKLEKTAMFIILILIIIVAAFSIVATLIMMVNDKNREIAILKSMGAKSSSIMRIFMLQGLIIGISGTVIGLAGGCFLAFLQNNFQIVSLSKDVYYIPDLTVKITSWDVFFVAFIAILISFIATLYPSRQAANLEPAEGLRYE